MRLHAQQLRRGIVDDQDARHEGLRGAGSIVCRRRGCASDVRSAPACARTSRPPASPAKTPGSCVERRPRACRCDPGAPASSRAARAARRSRRMRDAVPADAMPSSDTPRMMNGITVVAQLRRRRPGRSWRCCRRAAIMRVQRGEHLAADVVDRAGPSARFQRPRGPSRRRVARHALRGRRARCRKSACSGLPVIACTS